MTKTYVPGPIGKLIDLAAACRKDGWINTLTGIGTKKDKRVGGSAEWSRLSEMDAEYIYVSDEVARRIVSLIPDMGTKEGIEFKLPAGEDKGPIQLITKEFDRLKVFPRLNKSWTNGRLYGGAALFLSVDDSKDVSEPLDLKSIRQLQSLTPLTRYEIWHEEIDRDILSLNFGLPLYYATYQGVKKIHYSRIIRFDGADLPLRLFQANNYWHDSVLSAVWEIFRDWNMAYHSASLTLQDFRTAILKIKNLADIISSGQKNELADRIDMMNLAKSVIGSVVIDADSEDMSNLTTTLTGVDAILSKLDSRLVAATGLPHTVILGEGASGTLGGGGQSEDRNFKDSIKSHQEKNIKEPLDYLLQIIQAQSNGPFKGKINELLTYEFRPLWHPTEIEKADLRLKVAQADAVYLSNQVLSADEVANSRFGGDGYSMETTLDIEARAMEEETANISPEETVEIMKEETEKENEASKENI